MNETDMTFLIDQLVNSMEFYADETEFSQHFNNECDLPEEKGKQIFNAYWDLSPTERADWNTEQWEKWITRQLNSPVEKNYRVVKFFKSGRNPQTLYKNLSQSEARRIVQSIPSTEKWFVGFTKY